MKPSIWIPFDEYFHRGVSECADDAAAVAGEHGGLDVELVERVEVAGVLVEDTVRKAVIPAGLDAPRRRVEVKWTVKVLRFPPPRSRGSRHSRGLRPTSRRPARRRC